MFFHFSGISLILHLLIIFCAWIISFVRHDNNASVFQTYNKNGGLVKNQKLNSYISISIVLSVIIYMVMLFSLAVSTSIKVGATEPQIVFVKWLVSLVLTSIVVLFSYSIFQIFLLAVLIAVGGLYLYMKRLRIIYQFKYLDFKSLTRGLQLQRVDFVKSYFTRFSSALTLNSVLSKFLPLLVISTLALLPFLVAKQVSAQIVEPGFESEVVATGFSLATASAFAPDGRIFVAEKGGKVKVVKDGLLLPQPLVTLTDINTFGDRGLLGLAIDPDFSTNGYIYLSYTYENTPGANISGSKTGRIVRLTVIGDTASESTKVVLVGSVGGSVEKPSCEDFLVTDDCIPSDSNSHSVGGLKFGPDGKLYASLGDGADFASEDVRALRVQNIDALSGKVLRINTDGTAPIDNPFYDGNPNSNRSKVYALGFRNMFRFNFNETTGKMYGGDVGWSDWEEVNEIKAGANYGWPCREGNVATSYGCTPSSTSTDPIYTYAHDSFGAGSITGGSFFLNGAYPDSYANDLFIGDYAQMWIKRLVLDDNGVVVSVEDFIPNLVWPVDITTGIDGNIYYIDIVHGDLVRLTHTSGNRRPVVSVSANPASGLTPLVVQFSTAGTYDPDSDALTYLWNFGDGATSNLINPQHTYNANGTYQATVVVTDAFGSAVAKSLTITAGNQKPVATITDPVSGSFYRALEDVTVSGVGSDLEDGILPDSAFSWTVLLHHNVHIHTVQEFTNTKTITFTADDHADPDVYMEIILTVTDSVGLSNSSSINMYLNNGGVGGNLISNPSLEVVDVQPNNPKDWVIGWYGELDPVFTYPVAGLSGDKAARVDLLSFTSGNAKWYFSPLFVEVGKTYKFTDLYKANTETYITAQYGRSDGTYFYEFLATLPPAADPTSVELDITIPADAQTMTIFHEIASVGYLIVDEFSLSLVTSEADIIAPTGSITNLSDGDIVSGVVNVVVDAYDENGITKVHLMVGGVKDPDIEDTVAPYILSWDTTNYPDGEHMIMAHMHDPTDNHGTSTMVMVVIDNSSTTTNPTNLIFNGDFELVDGLGNPLGWAPNGWGTHTRVHTYPVTGFDGGSAARVQITKYGLSDTGDAKWVFSDVPVIPGTEYKYQNKYKAGSISDVIGRYTFANGTYHYFGLIKEIPSATEWADISGTFVPPVGAVSVTFFHLISSVTSLTIDDVAMYAVSTGTPAEINPPVVAVTAPQNGDTISGVVTLKATATDDTSVVGVYFAINGAPFGAEDQVAPYEINWDTTTWPDGIYIIKATSHDPFGNNAKSEITVTVDNSSVPPPPTSGNLILNGNLDTLGTAGNPANWKRGGWGTNNRTFTYPATGVTGNAAEVTVTSYTSGDAKWYFDEVAVVPNTEYTLSSNFKSTVASEVLLRYTLVSGAFQYQYLQGLPSTGGNWQTFNRVFTTPSNTQSVTAFHLIAGVGSLAIDDVELLGLATSTPDTLSPIVNMVSPTNESLVSGVVNVSVSVTDNVAVAGVSLIVDGVVIGGEDVTAPYEFSWDSLSVSNATHTISATARDLAGNVATASLISVLVNNSSVPPPPTSGNLILNGNLDTLGTAGNPANWKRGGWGTNNRTFTYPATGVTGNAAEVTVTSYTSGDAKWYFDEVAVVPGESYNFSHKYKATVPTNMTLRYTLTSGSYSYIGLGNIPVSADWRTNNISFIVPADVVAVTVMNILVGVGTLTVDDVVLTSASVNNNSFARGKVTFSFDDGWLEHYEVARPILDTADFDGTFYIVSNEMLGAVPTERLLNPTLDVEGVPGNPANWKRGGWGTNDRTFTYPATGVTGNAAEVTVTSYTSGDAKWYFDEVAIIPGIDYEIRESYRSDTPTEVLVRYTLASGAYQYQFVKGLPTTGGVWQSLYEIVRVPDEARFLTVFHVLAGVGTLALDDVSVKQVQIYANTDQVLSLKASGHEIGAHTRTHASLPSLSYSAKLNEINGSKSDLEAAGLGPITSIAYPYGDYDTEVQQIVADSGFALGRSVLRGFNDITTDRYTLKIQQIERGRTLSEMQSWINSAAANKTWLILMFHQISDDQTANLGISESDFTSIVNYTKTADVDVITVAEGATLLNP